MAWEKVEAEKSCLIKTKKKSHLRRENMGNYDPSMEWELQGESRVGSVKEVKGKACTFYGQKIADLCEHGEGLSSQLKKKTRV